MTGGAVLYLHGFRSSPAAQKCRILSELCRQNDIPFFAPDINRAPSAVAALLLDLVREEPPRAIFGASLGGFYADWLSRMTGACAVLLNPVVSPERVIGAYLGAQTIFGTDRVIQVEASFAQELAALKAQGARARRLLAVIASGDEVLDPREAQTRYAQDLVWRVEGDCHRLLHFEAMAPELLAFALENRIPDAVLARTPSH